MEKENHFKSKLLIDNHVINYFKQYNTLISEFNLFLSGSHSATTFLSPRTKTKRSGGCLNFLYNETN